MNMAIMIALCAVMYAMSAAHWALALHDAAENAWDNVVQFSRITDCVEQILHGAGCLVDSDVEDPVQATQSFEMQMVTKTCLDTACLVVNVRTTSRGNTCRVS